jgi:predicted nucleic acid-binding protein
MIVIDASLAVKWFVVEVDSDLAFAFLNSHARHLVAPDLIAIEVASTFVRRANVNKVEARDMEEALDEWAGFLSGTSIELHLATPSSICNAGLLTQTLGHPLKDCVYLGLAIELDCDFVTCDAKFAAKADMIFPRTKLLRELKS